MDVDSYKILEKDFEGKGVSVQPNPMELPEAEAKAVFDQLTKEVVTPKFNAFVEAFRELDLTSDEDKPISKDTKEALDKKVDKEFRTGSEDQYKVLSDNNFDDAAKKDVENSARDRHIHENKEILDALDSEWKSNILYKDNTEAYEPKEKYNPATKGYVDQAVFDSGSADMTKSVYDPNGKSQDIFAYADRASLIQDQTTGEYYFFGIDSGGLFIQKEDMEYQVAMHNADSASHENLMIDGNAAAVSSGDTLAEHEVNPAAHQNLVVDGNQ